MKYNKDLINKILKIKDNQNDSDKDTIEKLISEYNTLWLYVIRSSNDKKELLKLYQDIEQLMEENEELKQKITAIEQQKNQF